VKEKSRSRFARGLLVSGVFLSVILAARLQAQDISPEAAASARSKLAQLQGGAMVDPASSFTFSKLEINSWVAAELAQRAGSGVDSVAADFQQGRVSGVAQLDFDLLRRASRRPMPPLSEYVLTGKHELRAEGNLSGSGGKGQFTLQSVSIDGLPIPSLLFDLLLNTLLRGRFPEFNLNAPFDLPYSIDSLRVEPGQVIVAGSGASR
jgi:hypothetical protein